MVVLRGSTAFYGCSTAYRSGLSVCRCLAAGIKQRTTACERCTCDSSTARLFQRGRAPLPLRTVTRVQPGRDQFSFQFLIMALLFACVSLASAVTAAPAARVALEPESVLTGSSQEWSVVRSKLALLAARGWFGSASFNWTPLFPSPRPRPPGWPCPPQRQASVVGNARDLRQPACRPRAILLGCVHPGPRGAVLGPPCLFLCGCVQAVHKQHHHNTLNTRQRPHTLSPF